MKESGVWLSLVERCVRDAEAGGSNPLTPTKNTAKSRILPLMLFLPNCNTARNPRRFGKKFGKQVFFDAPRRYHQSPERSKDENGTL